MTYYIGQQITDLLGDTPRYFYGLRRTDTGELFLAKIDQLKDSDGIQINKPGDYSENFTEFLPGQDFFEGRNVKHEKVYENLNYEQFLWDDKNLYYYINQEGELVVRINQSVVYTNTVSSEGIE